MLRTLRSLAIFIFVFNVDVKVKAEEVKGLKSKPEGCFEEALQRQMTKECFVYFNQAEKYDFEFRKSQIKVLNSSLVKILDGNLFLIEGRMAIKTKKPFQVTTLYGPVTNDGGEFWVEVDAREAVVTNLSGRTVVRIGQRLIETPEKMKFSFWSVREGLISSGVPSLHPVETFIKKWSEFYFGPKKEFLADLEEYKKEYSKAIDSESLLHEKIVQRHLASVEEAQNQRRKRQQTLKDEEQARKKLLYEKAFER